MTLLGPTDIQRVQTARDPGVRASAPQIRDPRAAALGDFASSLNQVSTAFKTLYKQKEGLEDDASYQKFALEFTQSATAAQAEMLSGPSAGESDFVDQLDQRLQQVQDQTFASLEQGGYKFSEEGRLRAEQYAMQTRISSARTGAVEANNQRISLLKDDADNTVLEIARQAGSDGDLVSAYGKIDAVAARVGGFMAPDKARAYKDAARVAVVESAINGHKARDEYDQAQAIIDNETGFAADTATQVQMDVIQAAQNGGVDPAVLLAIGQLESGMDPNAPSPPKELPTLAYPEANGLVAKGNIDLNARPSVPLPNGEIATLRSISFEVDGEHVLVPTVSPDGKIMSDEEAFQRYKDTGEFLGKFDTEAQATAYAKQLSKEQGTRYGPNAGKASSAAEMFQMTDATAAALGLPRGQSALTQAQAAARLTASNIDILNRALGGQPSPAEVYMAHVLGAPMAVRVMQADASLKASTVLTPAQIIANPQFKDMTVSEVYGWMKRKMQDGMNAIAPALQNRNIAVDAAGVPLSAIPSLNAGLNEAKKQAQARLQVRLDDNSASIRTTGKALDGIDPQKVKDLMGDDYYDAWRQQTIYDGTFWNLTKDMKDMTEEQMQAQVDAAAPVGGTEYFRMQQALQESVSSEMARVLKARDSSPETAAVTGLMDDNLASLRASGVPVQMDEQKLRASMTAAEYQTYQNEVADAQSFYQATKDMKGMDEAQIKARVDSLTPPPGDPDTIRKMKLQDEVRAYGNQVINDRLIPAKGADMDRLNADIASIKATGKELPIDLNDLKLKMSPDAFDAYMQLRTEAHAYYDAVGDAVVTPDSTLRQREQALRAEGGQEGYDRQVALHQEVSDYTKKLLMLRRTDPALAVAEAPDVIKAFETAPDKPTQQAWDDIITARYATMDGINMPKEVQQPLTNDELGGWIQILKDAPEEKWNEAFATVAYGIESAYGKHADAVMRQLLGHTNRSNDQSGIAAKIIGDIVKGRPIDRNDAIAMDQAAENDRIRAAADMFNTTYAPRWDAPFFNVPMPFTGGAGFPVFNPLRLGNPFATTQPDIPVAPETAIQDLRAAPDTIDQFIQRYGLSQVPPDLRSNVPNDVLLNNGR